MKNLTIVFLLLFCAAQSLLAQNENAIPPNDQLRFDGFYLGVAFGSQNIFGGSFVNGVDVLAQDSRFVTDFSAGYRRQFFKGRMMFGAELQTGITDGDLMHEDPENQLFIKYENSSQWGVGLTLGAALGKRKNILVFAYGNETKRRFDVRINENGSTYNQKDKQGMLKYGLGLEVPVYKGLNVRATFGGLRVDFGDLVTNIDVEDKADIMAGLLWQF